MSGRTPFSCPLSQRDPPASNKRGGGSSKIKTTASRKRRRRVGRPAPPLPGLAGLGGGLDIAASKLQSQASATADPSAEPARSPPPDRRSPSPRKISGAARLGSRATDEAGGGRWTSQLSARRGHERCFCNDEEVRLVADRLPLEAKEAHGRKSEGNQGEAESSQEGAFRAGRRGRQQADESQRAQLQ